MPARTRVPRPSREAPGSLEASSPVVRATLWQETSGWMIGGSSAPISTTRVFQPQVRNCSTSDMASSLLVSEVPRAATVAVVIYRPLRIPIGSIVEAGLQSVEVTCGVSRENPSTAMPSCRRGGSGDQPWRTFDVRDRELVRRPSDPFLMPSVSISWAMFSRTCLRAVPCGVHASLRPSVSTAPSWSPDVQWHLGGIESRIRRPDMMRTSQAAINP